MALITLTSASGSPGVTTTVLGLALRWPRPVLVVEADPTGGSGILAGYFRGQVPHDGGLIDLAMAHGEDDVAAELPHQLLDIPNSQAQLLPGSRSHTQSAGLSGLWPALLDVLRDLEATGQDVLVDAGRLGLDGCPTSLVFGADATLLLTRSTLPTVIAATSWAGTLREQVDAAVTRTGVVVVGQGQPYSGREVASALGLPLVGSLPWDRRSAAVLSRGHGAFARRALLVAGLSALGEAIRSLASGGIARQHPSASQWLASPAPQELVTSDAVVDDPVRVGRVAQDLGGLQ